MGKKLYPSNVLKEAIDAEEAWKNIDEDLAFGKLNIAGLVMDIEGIEHSQHELAALETQLTEVRNRRDAFYLSAWDKVKRMRAGMKVIYGDDSTEYKMAGGTRRSERKRVRRTPATE